MATVVIQKRIRKKGMSYAIQYADPLTGKKKHYMTCRKYKQAHYEANELRAVLDSGRPPEQRKKLDPLTFSEVAASLKKELESRLKRKEISDKTYSDYCIWLNVLNRTFDSKMLCKITEEEILNFRDAEIEKNSVISANRYFILIRYVFKHGLKLNAIITNPTEAIKLISEKSHERKEFLFPYQLDQVIEAAKKTRAKHYLPAIILLGAEHGASKQEILSLRWARLNLDYAGKGIIALYRTKNNRQRTEFLMPRTRQALKEWKDHLELKRKKDNITNVSSDFVFCRIDGTPLQGFKSAWRETLKLAAIKDFHFHDLRHTFASNLILSGASLKDVKEMIGHSDISMTDRYSHLSLNHKLAKQNQLAEYYSTSEGSNLVAIPKNP
jgi:integrase